MLEKTIDSLKKTNLITDIVVSTDSMITAKKAEEYGVKYILRPKKLSSKKTSLVDVLEFTLKEVEKKGKFYDIIAVAEEIYPFRNEKVVKEMIQLMFTGIADTLYAAWEEKRITWYGSNDDLEILGGSSWIMKKSEKNNNVITSLAGYLLLVKPAQIRQKSLFSSVNEAYVIKDPIAVVAIHNTSELKEVISLFKKTII